MTLSTNRRTGHCQMCGADFTAGIRGQIHRYCRLCRERAKYLKDSRRLYKRSALIRAGFRCEICSRSSSDTRLHIHHKDGKGEHKTGQPNNNLDNLIVLCGHCHMSRHDIGCSIDVKEVRQLRGSGQTLNQIGQTYGVSRQRILQILQGARWGKGNIDR